MFTAVLENGNCLGPLSYSVMAPVAVPPASHWPVKTALLQPIGVGDG